MRLPILALCAAALAVGPATAAEFVNKPIDTNKLVVQPSQAVAGLTAQTIQMAGGVAANSIEQHGVIRTINNLLRSPTMTDSPKQSGGLPQPYTFRSTMYKSYNAPVMPSTMPSRR